MVHQNLLDLPLEVLEKIWKFCDRRSLVKFSLCSKKCNSLITHVLYSKIFVHTIGRNVGTIISGDRLKFAKYLSFRSFKRCCSMQKDSCSWEDDVAENFLSIIGACDPLKVIDLSISHNSDFSSDMVTFVSSVLVNLTALSLSCPGKISGFAFKCLSRMKYLKKLNLERCEIPCNSLPNFLCLTELHIVSCICVSDVTLDSISKMVTLKHLHINCCVVNLDKLKGLVLLENLDVYNSPVSNETGLSFSLHTIWPFPLLRDLNIGGCHISDNHLQPLKNLKHLHILNICSNIITDVGLKYVSEVVSLHKLYIYDNSNITDDGTRYLTSLVLLRIIDIEDCDQLTGKCLEYLSTLPLLRDLNIGKYHITDNQLQLLQKLKHLQILDISCNNITDVGLKYISELVSLHELILYGNDNITDEGIRYLTSLVLLRKIDIERCEELTDKCLEYLITLPLLRDLNIGSIGYITDYPLQFLQKLKHLQILDISYNNITDDGLKYISELVSLRELKFGS